MSRTIKIDPVTRMTFPRTDRDHDGTLDAKSVTATYEIDLSGLPSFLANGLYTIRIDGGIISDSNRTIADAADPLKMVGRTLGGFIVNVNSPDVLPPAVSFTVYSPGIARGPCGASGVRCGMAEIGGCRFITAGGG